MQVILARGVLIFPERSLNVPVSRADCLMRD